MKRQKTLMWMAAGTVFVLAVAVFVVRAVRRDEMMHAALADLQAANQADSVFTSDSTAQVLVNYFDEPWHRANDRVLAYYLLGRAHADMGEAPQAIEAYQTAIERADTTAEDCDFRILRNVYGQMADIFERQNLWDSELEAYQYYGIYSQKIGDIYEYARSYLFVSDVLFNKGDVTSALQFINIAKQIYLEEGMQKEASQVYASPIHFAILHRQFDKARPMMETYERESGLFDAYGNIQQGREIYYYDKGVYYLNCLQPDSAEYMFRKLLPIQANAIDAYRGLLKLFRYQGNVDSIAKYAASYEDALVEYLNTTQTGAVMQAKSMYDYNRHRRQAELEKRSRQQAQTALMIISFVCVILITVFYFVHRQHRREKAQMAYDLQHAEEDLRATNQEIAVLRQAANKGEGMESLLAQRERKVQELQDQIAYLKGKMKIPFDTDITSATAKADIIQHFHTISRSHIWREGNQTKPAAPRAASEKEWKVLIGMMRFHYPQFFLFVTTEHQLSQQEYRICMLSRLSFEPSAIATLLGTSLPTVSNARKRIAGKLFQLDSASTLDEKLKELP